MRIILIPTIALLAGCTSSGSPQGPSASGESVGATTLAVQGPVTVTRRVVIRNTTRAQTFSPPIVISHDPTFRLFELGELASDALVDLAENGQADTLRTKVAGSPDVLDVVVAPGPLRPGESVTLTVHTSDRFPLVSAAGRLGETNDGFFAARGIEASVDDGDQNNVPAYAYDSGTQANTEKCNNIAGPGPCSAASGARVRAIVGSEERVLVHSGIHGVGDLSRDYDWRGPVATVSVTTGS
jgi:hypothetical protein